MKKYAKYCVLVVAIALVAYNSVTHFGSVFFKLNHSVMERYVDEIRHKELEANDWEQLFEPPDNKYDFYGHKEHEVTLSFGLFSGFASYTKLDEARYCILFRVPRIFALERTGYLYVSDDDPDRIESKISGAHNGERTKLCPNWYKIVTHS